MYTISLLGEKSFKVNEGVLLLDALIQNGYILPAPCGGNGTCGKCKVQITGATQTVELSFSQAFQELYVAHMSFEGGVSL